MDDGDRPFCCQETEDDPVIADTQTKKAPQFTAERPHIYIVARICHLREYPKGLNHPLPLGAAELADPLFGPRRYFNRPSHRVSSPRRP